MFHTVFATLLVMPDKVGWLSLNFGEDFPLEDFFICTDFVACIVNHYRKPVLSWASLHREMDFYYRDVEIVEVLTSYLGTL